MIGQISPIRTPKKLPRRRPTVLIPSTPIPVIRKPIRVPTTMAVTGTRATAGVRNVAAEQLHVCRRDMTRIAAEGRRLIALVSEIDRVGSGTRPKLIDTSGSNWPCVDRVTGGSASDHWTRGIHMVGGPRGWTSVVPGLDAPGYDRPDKRIGSLLRAANIQQGRLSNAISGAARSGSLSGLGDGELEMTPMTAGLLGFAMGAAGVYLITR